MTRLRTIGGRRYIEVAVVARLYDVDEAWLRELADFGLLRAVVVVEQVPCIAVDELDRVAQIKRLHVHLEVGLEAVAVLLGPGS